MSGSHPLDSEQHLLSPPATAAPPDSPDTSTALPNQVVVQPTQDQSEPPASTDMPALRSRDEFLMVGVTAIPPTPELCSICTEPMSSDIVKINACSHPSTPSVS
jgi:hypothetical protein